MRALLTLLILTATATAQWQLQQSHTTASLRGIHALGNGVAWASGTGGTVLRTLDDGATWQPCTIPAAAEHLDFRGIQAFDAQTAIVMSSGKGDLSRLYKTTDACQTWNLVFTNPDKEGFWDGIQFAGAPPYRRGVVIGDPVDGKFVEFDTNNDGDIWLNRDLGQSNVASARYKESLFAASNSSLIVTNGGGEIFVTGGVPGSRSRVLSEFVKHDPRVSWKYVGGEIPLAVGDSAGAFSIAIALGDGNSANTAPKDKWTLLYVSKGVCVSVGGDYKKPDSSSRTAAFTTDSGLHWTPAKTPPHGYRSAVAYSPTHKAWITVGPNGTDLSTDDGRTWHPLKPTAPNADPEEDQHWNALSLPFVVGPKGRIGKLREDAIPH